MNWPAYPEYTESGVEWLEEIPAGWEMQKLRRVCSLTTGWTPPSGDEASYQGDNPWANISDLGPRVLDRPEKSISDGAIRVARIKLSPKGSLLFSFKLSIGRVSFAGCDMYTNEAIATFQSSANLDLDFAYYSFPLTLVRNANENIYGAKLLNQDLMNSARLPIPSLVEQGLIAKFLDRETGKIDTLIDKQHQVIATLREDRTAAITHAVTKGLNPDVEMKDTGLGPIPAHWSEGTRLKRVATVQTGLTLGKTPSATESVILPYLRVANVQAGGVDLREVKNVEIDRSEISKYLLRAGDVLMTEGGDIDKLGRGCVWDGQIAPCVHQNHIFAVRCSHELENRYLVYLLDTSIARDYFYLTAKKTTNLASTNSTTLGRFSFPLPPSDEQVQIIDFLNAECSRIDALIDGSAKSIMTLREYRAALITAAVTGKIDVREAV